MSKSQYWFDDIDVDGMSAAAAAFGHERYGYVVTPNVDHLIRLHDEPSLLPIYEQASFVTLDSRFLALLLRLVGGSRLRTCPGSDLTQRLLEQVVRPDDVLLLIGCSTEQAQALRQPQMMAPRPQPMQPHAPQAGPRPAPHAPPPGHGCGHPGGPPCR